MRNETSEGVKCISPKRKRGIVRDSRVAVVGCRLFKEDIAWLRARAKDHGISLADELRVLVRKIIKTYQAGGLGDDL